MTNADLVRRWKAGAAIDVDRVWAEAWAMAKQDREEKQRATAAMLAAGQRQSIKEEAK